MDKIGQLSEHNKIKKRQIALQELHTKKCALKELMDLYDEDDPERKKVKKEYMALLRDIVDGDKKENNTDVCLFPSSSSTPIEDHSSIFSI